MKLLNKELLKTNIEKIAEYDLSNNKIFGSAYCVYQNDKVVYKNCFGTSVLNSQEPVTDKTLFRLASMTKPITAIAALILIDRGLLTLTDSVSKYLPEFKEIHITKATDTGKLINLGKAKNSVTIRHLLAHTSGIGSEALKINQMTAEDKETIDNTVAFHFNSGLDFEPETEQRYSGTGAFDVLVKIIEKITQTDYLSFLKKEIFEPCDMTDTTFVPNQNQWSRLIEMHNKFDGKNSVGKMKENCIFEDYPCTHYLGGAGLVSTLSDYLKFALMLLNEGKLPTKQLISRETFNLMHTPSVPQKIMSGNEIWGLGVRIISKKEYGHLPVGTYGWSGAYGSHFWIDAENKIAAVFMKNSLFDGGAGNDSAVNFEKAVNASFE